MRLDRLVTLRLVRPWCTRAARCSRLPILMYHRIATAAVLPTHAYYGVCTSRSRFAEQMQWLDDAGWEGMSVTDALRITRTRGGKSRRVVALTFDDGFRDFQLAAPILRQHGFGATVYLPTAFIRYVRASFQSADCLTWPEVRDLHASGVEFGSHTVNHPQLHALPWNEIRHELTVSKARIEHELGSPIGGFSYPYAFPQADAGFRHTLSALLRELNYRHAVTTVIGRIRPDDDALSLQRLPVNDADDRDLLLAKLQGAYDWLAVPQTISKVARRFLAPATRRPIGAS